MSRYRLSSSIQHFNTVLLGTIFSVGCNVALAASNLDCEKALKSSGANKAQNVCQQALVSQREAVLQTYKKATVDALARAYHNLGMLYNSMGAYNEAEREFRMEAALLEQMYPKGSATTALAYSNIGALFQRSGKPDPALAYYRQAISMLEKTASNDAQLLTGPLFNLSTLHSEQKRFTDAKTVLLRLLQIHTRLNGPDSAQTADIHNRLGVTYQRLNGIAQADAQLRKALTIRENLFGSNHLLVAESCSNLGQLLIQQRRLDEALVFLRHAAAVTHALTGPQSEKTRTAWKNLELLYGRMIQNASQGT